MFFRATRWIVAAIVGLAMTAIGCAESPSHGRERHLTRATTDTSVVHALDTQIEDRLVDRLELDNFLRDRDIRVRVVDGTVNVTGEVWTSLERERVSSLLRGVPGVIDVANDLDVRPPQ